MNTHIHQASTSLYYLEGTRLNLVALILAIATVVALLALRRTRTPDDDDSNRVLGITTTVGTLYGVGAVIAGVAIAGRELFTSPITVPMQIEPSGFSSTDTALEGPGAVLYGVWLDEIHVEVLGLTWTTRLLLAFGALFILAVHAVLAVLIVKLASRLRDGHSFDIRAISLARTSAILVVVFGVGGSHLRQLGSNAAAHEALGSDHVYSNSHFPYPVIGQFGDYDLRPPEAFEFAIPLWPFLVALAIAVLTLLIRQYQSMAAARARLEDEVSGLV